MRSFDNPFGAFYLGRKGSNNRAAWRVLQDIAQILVHFLVGTMTLFIGRAKALEHEYGRALLLEQMIISHMRCAFGISFHGPVSRMQYGCDRCLNDGADRIHDRVFHLEKFNRKFPELDHISNLVDIDNFQFFGRPFLEIFLLVLDESNGERARNNDRIAKLFEQDRRGTDMVKMAVRKNHAADIFFFPDQIFRIWDHVINPRHVFFRKLDTHVENDNVALVLIHGHIAAYFFTSADRNNAQDIICAFWDIHILGYLARYRAFVLPHFLRRPAAESSALRLSATTVPAFAAVATLLLLSNHIRCSFLLSEIKRRKMNKRE